MSLLSWEAVLEHLRPLYERRSFGLLTHWDTPFYLHISQTLKKSPLCLVFFLLPTITVILLSYNSLCSFHKSSSSSEWFICLGWKSSYHHHHIKLKEVCSLSQCMLRTCSFIVNKKQPFFHKYHGPPVAVVTQAKKDRFLGEEGCTGIANTQSRSNEGWWHSQTCKNTNVPSNCHLNFNKEQGVKMSFLLKICDNQNMVLHWSSQVHILMQCFTSLFDTYLKIASFWFCFK